MNNKINYHIVPFGQSRFAVANEKDEIIDNAQGYGYKTRQVAFKAMNWKVGGGKEKVQLKKQQVKDWIKLNPAHAQIIKKFDEYMEWNVKELSRGEVTEDDIWRKLEKEFSIIIPAYIRK